MQWCVSRTGSRMLTADKWQRVLVIDLTTSKIACNNATRQEIVDLAIWNEAIFLFAFLGDAFTTSPLFSI